MAASENVIKRKEKLNFLNVYFFSFTHSKLRHFCSCTHFKGMKRWQCDLKPKTVFINELTLDKSKIQTLNFIKMLKNGHFLSGNRCDDVSNCSIHQDLHTRIDRYDFLNRFLFLKLITKLNTWQNNALRTLLFSNLL